MTQRVRREIAELVRLNPTMLPGHLAKVFSYRRDDVETVWAELHQPRKSAEDRPSVLLTRRKGLDST